MMNSKTLNILLMVITVAWTGVWPVLYFDPSASFAKNLVGALLVAIACVVFGAALLLLKKEPVSRLWIPLVGSVLAVVWPTYIWFMTLAK